MIVSGIIYRILISTICESTTIRSQFCLKARLDFCTIALSQGVTTMPVVKKVLAEDVKSAAPVTEPVKRGRGRPKGSKNKPKTPIAPRQQTPISGAAFIANSTPADKRAYKWTCKNGHKLTMYMRTYGVTCGTCGCEMKCDDLRGILKD